MRKRFLSLAATLLSMAGLAQTHQLDINLKKAGAPIPSTLYGIFFEDINYAADGGLYAELVKNRSFEFPNDALQGWKAFGKVEVREDGPFERNPHYVRLSDPGHPHKWTGLDNEGFFGIGVKEGAAYRFSVWARVPDGGESQLRIELANTASMGENHYLCQETLPVAGKEWKKYQLIIRPDRTLDKSVLRIFLTGGRNTVDLEHVSLFPVDTWMGHENGLRKDLAQALYDLRPGVFRFPGGCIVEGTDLETRYNWKNSVGPVENRPLNENRWEYTFPHRFYPDYYQSYGLGFYEFFQLSEEIGAEPLPILSCGLACQFQNENPDAHCPVDELQPFIQDALDLIEFANGSVDTKWGKVRAEMGHPEPFHMKFLAIGNEQWGETYPQHLEPFVKAIRKQHPVRFAYEDYRKESVFVVEHALPHYLKESQGRWYLLAYNDGVLKTYGIERMNELCLMEDETFARRNIINVAELFSECYGIWNDEQIPIEDIELSYSPLDGRFLKSLPLHHSQHILIDDDQEFRIALRLRITNDFVMALLSRSTSLTVIKPESLRNRVRDIYREALRRNGE